MLIQTMYFPIVNAQSGKSAILMSTPHPTSWFDTFVKDDSGKILKEKFVRVCDDCIKKEMCEWEYCIHTKYEGALTKDFGENSITSLVDPNKVLQEEFGVTVELDESVFPKEDLNWMFNRENYAEINFEKVCFV